MTDNKEFIKFLDAQNQVYLKTLSKLKKEKKTPTGCGTFFPN